MICIVCNQDDADTIDREGKWYHRRCWIQSILAENETLRQQVAELRVALGPVAINGERWLLETPALGDREEVPVWITVDEVRRAKRLLGEGGK